MWFNFAATTGEMTVDLVDIMQMMTDPVKAKSFPHRAWGTPYCLDLLEYYITLVLDHVNQPRP